MAHTTNGTPYTRWATVGMPKLGKYHYLLDIVFFLYPDEASAAAGTRAGGTGFFVAIPSETYPDCYHHIYAVTNRHVACGNTRELSPCPVVRVNSVNGKPDIFEFDPAEWQFLAPGADIAVIPIDLKRGVHKAEALDVASFFLSDEEKAHHEINAGEDVFMLGRFIDYDGVEANSPSMRFGNISMMNAAVPQFSGYLGNSIVVDMHSRTGFSGSPVFVYRTAGSIFGNANTLMSGGHLMKLLGILWGQFPEEWGVRDMSQSTPPAAAMINPKSVLGWSGMSLVCPASEIRKVLYMPELKKRRAAIDAGLHQKFRGAAVPQSAAPPASDANPTHREDFTSLLNEAARKPKQDD